MIIREPTIQDQSAFILAMQRSQALHHPWVKSPQTEEAFKSYIQQRWAMTYEDWLNIKGASL